MLKRILCFGMIALYLLICIGCQSGSKDGKVLQQDHLAAQMQTGDKLLVYLSGISHGFKTEKGDFTIYPSKYHVGTRAVGGEIDAISGNVFAQAIMEYSEQKGIPVEIHFLEEEFSGTDPFQELYNQGKPLPDLLVVGKYTRYDYNRLVQQGLLLDFDPYIQQDEAWSDTERYYSKVLEGGRLSGGQCALPILFNLNGMITSASYLQEIGMASLPETITYQEGLQLLEKSCIEMRESKQKEAIFDTNGMAAGRYIPSILTAAAYSNYFEEVDGDCVLDANVIESIFHLMERFNEQEFVNVIGWENKTYLENVNSRNKSLLLSGLEKDAYQNIGVFLSGGRCGGANYYNSLLTDAAYFHSVYTENNDEMVLRGIPTFQDENSYSANISLMAFSFASTKYPEIVYDMGRYLMDYEFPPFYGFSVNQELTEKQLEDIQKTTITIYPDWIWSSYMAGDIDGEELKNQIEEMKPLNKESVDMIRNMLNHIAGAGLPCSVLEYSLYSSMLNMVGDGVMTPKEAAAWVIENMEHHLEIQKELEPFYDEAYEASIRLRN